MDNFKRKPFIFTDPRQERIYKKLLEIGPGPAAFFKDSCRMWEDDYPLEARAHYIAHASREILGSVLDVMLPFNFTPSLEGIKAKSTHAEKVKAIFQEYEIDPKSDIAQLWIRMTKEKEDIALYQFVHRNALNSPKDTTGIFEDVWEGIQSLLNTLLHKMEGKYVGYFITLDRLIEVSTPTKKHLTLLKNNIPNSSVTYNYFFEKLESPHWLTPLISAGFFKSPPPPIEHPEGGVSYPFWPQAYYLRKMALIPEKQKEILDICLNVKTENPRTNSELLEIALLLPVEMAVQIVENIDNIDDFLSSEKYGKLIVYFAKNGKSKESVALAQRVFAIIPDPREAPEYEGHKIFREPVSVIEEYEYEKILEKDYPDFVDAAGIDAIRVLLDQIDKYIEYSDSNRESGSKDDYSEIWRSTIEDHSQNHKHGIKDVLVTGLRDSCEKYLSKKPKQIDILLAELESRKLLVFKRLKLHLLRLFPNNSEKSIAEALMDENEFGINQRLTHEYFLLAEAHGSVLSEKQRDELWSWIESGGDKEVEAYIANCRERGEEPSDDEATKYKKSWQMYHLLPFISLDSNWRKYYEELTVVVGEPVHPSLRSWSSGGSFGYTSAISDEQFKQLKPKEIVRFLKAWEPPAEGGILETSREGTYRALVKQISNDPSKWSGSLKMFSDLDPTFCRAVFTGHRDAIRQGNSFEWKPLLNLSAVVLTKPIEASERKLSGFYGDDPDWNWCRKAIVELIKEGLDSEKGTIPFELKVDVWNIIESLTHDADPTAEEEDKQLESDSDPLTVAIGSTRGNAIQAAIRYGIWLKSQTAKDKQRDWKISTDAPELSKVLNDHLNVRIEPSVSIRAIYGERFGNLAWLDTKWIEENRDRIFPEKPKEQKYFDSAWDAFITFNTAYNDLIPLLIPTYKRAIGEIGRHTNARHYPENPEQYLAEHLTLFYCRGKIPLDKGLLNEFYSVAPLELRASIINFIGRSAEKREMTEDIRDRFTSLMNHRLQEIRIGENHHEDIQEFEDFGWVVYSKKFDDKWGLITLMEILELGCDIQGDHLVLERFIELVSDYPLEVITSLELMVENDKKGWGVPTWGEELTNVIRLVLGSKNSAAVNKATEFIQKLVAKGHVQYRDLLPK